MREKIASAVVILTLLTMLLLSNVNPDSITGPGALNAYYFDGSKGLLDLTNGKVWALAITNINASQISGNKVFNFLVQDHGTGSGWESLVIQVHVDNYGAGGHLLQSYDNGWVLKSSHGFNPGDVPGNFDLRMLVRDLGANYQVTPQFRLPGGGWTTFYDGSWTSANFELTQTRVAIQVDSGGDGTVTFDPPTLYSDGIWHVYPPCSIQNAINEASSGDTIFVHEGTYYEAVLINKPLNVTGAGSSTTFINGTGVTLSSAGLVKITANYNEVKFSGFTVSNAPPVGSNRVMMAIYSKSNLAGPTYTITNNRIYGSNNPDEEEDYGFYAQSGKENIVFRNNLITQTGANNIVLECHTGRTEISHNTLDAGVWGTDTIFFMTYNGIDVTTLQNVSYNTFDMGTGGPFDYNHKATGVSFTSPGPAWGLGEAKFTNMVITGNTFNNLKSHRRGIGFWNAGTGDNLQSPVVTHNVINGVPGSTGSYGIDFYGFTSNTVITWNTITGVDNGIALRNGDAPGTKINYNNVAGNAIGINWTIGSSTIDASFNWWDNSTGPSHSSNPDGTGDAISDNVDYSPWLDDTFEVAPRTYHVNPTGTIQEAIDEATPGDTIVVHDGTYYEHLVVNKPLTITSASSPIIDGGASGYCITVSANNVVISGFEIRNGYLGISIQNAIGTQVCNNRIIDFIKGGIVARGAKNIFIEGNNISTTLHDEAPNGIDIGTYSGTTGIVRGNRISGCSWNGFTGDYEVTWSGSGILVIESGDSLEIIGNTVHDCDVGMDIESDLMNITYNEVYDNVYGFVFWNVNPKVNYNNIYSNTQYGVYRTAGGDLTGVLDACYNWWGDPTGPYHPELNPSGEGDAISDNVKFEPWLIEPYPPPTEVETLLYIDPADVEYWTVSSGKAFTIDVKVANVTDLHALEFKLYWDTTLLDLVTVQITPPWSTYFIAKNETNEALGRYWISMASQGTSTFSGSTTLVKLTFKITFDPIYPENKTCKLDLSDTKLSAPEGVPIYHMTHDGEYDIYSTKPKIVVDPATYTAHAFGKTFIINITVQEVVNLYNFSFQLSYDTTLLDAVNLEIGPFLNSPIYRNKYIMDDANGLIWLWVWSEPPAPPASGSGVLAKITFKVTKATTWTTKHSNILSCALDLHDTLLVTNIGITVQHDTVDGIYRYEPKPGDLDKDGHVGLTDLRILAYYYDPAYDPVADLNEDGVVDVYDLSILAYYYGEDC
jgi:nitrous oxidase accessory protein NosD